MYFFGIFIILIITPLIAVDTISFVEPQEVLALVKPYLPIDPIIVEAGAYNGHDSIAMARFWPEAHIHSFEPIPELYGILRANTREFSNIITYPLAIGPSTGIQTMYVSEEHYNPGMPSQSSSLLEPKEHLKYAATTFPKKIEVVVKTFDSWAQQYGIDKVDFMWLDMQGIELQALQACPRLLKTVRVILTEVEFVEAYKDQSLFDEVKKWLEQEGFTMIATNTSCGWFGDALFVRNDLINA